MNDFGSSLEDRFKQFNVPVLMEKIESRFKSIIVQNI